VLGNPAAWVVGTLAVVGVLWWYRRRTATPGTAPYHPWPDAAIAVVVAALVASVMVQTASASASNILLRDSWSMVGDTTSVLRGDPNCGFADDAVALTGTARLPSTALGGPASPPSDDDISFQNSFENRPVVPDDVEVWTTRTDEPVDQTIELVTPWYDLGGMTERDVLAMGIAGQPDGGTTAVAEYAGPDATPLPAVTAVDTDEVEELSSVAWAGENLGARQELPEGAALVRFRLTDRNLTREGWLTVTAPYLIVGQPLSELFDGTSVALDWPIGFNMPCVDPPRVADGMVEPVDFVVFSDTFADSPDITIVDDRGGAYGTLAEVAGTTTYRGFLPTTSPDVEWGRLVALDYDLPTDAFRIDEGTRTIAGWGWWPGAGPGPSPEDD
jgi:arabinosyltransferase C